MIEGERQEPVVAGDDESERGPLGGNEAFGPGRLRAANAGQERRQEH